MIKNTITKLKNKVTLLNMISSLLLQLVTIISGFIVPKLILSTFGSNINGLVSSLNQFLSYITLLEGGITGIIMTNLYKPLVEKDYNKVGTILKTADSFYKKIGFIFMVYSFIVATIYPVIFNVSFSYFYVFSLTIILSINLFVQYMFSLTLRTLLNADKKIYIVSMVQILITILNVINVVIVAKYFKSIHVLKIASGLLYFIQPIIFNIYIKKNYNIDLKYENKKDKHILNQRWNGLAINTAYFIHSSTDITILTVFTTLATVSIYSIYSLVVSSIRQLINSIIIGVNPSLGQTYATGDIDEIEKKLNIYEYIVFVLVFSLFSITSLLITNFVILYTDGINDANYNQSLFGVLLIIAEALYLLKMPHLNLAYSANKYKEITRPAFIEATINIVISIVLVNKLGIIGVAIGTCCAMLYRLVFHIKFTRKLINRRQWIYYSKMILFLVANLIGITICIFIIPPMKLNISSWILHAVIYSIIIVFINFLVSFIFFKNELYYFKKYLNIKKNII